MSTQDCHSGDSFKKFEKTIGNETSLIALLGNPNCGKTALFNSLTDGRQKVGNYAGVTVERKEGVISDRFKHAFRVLDLPGIYSFNARTPDERVSRDALFGVMDGEERPKVTVLVVDATQLRQNLVLVAEAMEYKIPMVIALNRWDIAQKRGISIDLERLSQALGVPVVCTVATEGKGLEQLLDAVAGQLKKTLHDGAKQQEERNQTLETSSDEIVRKTRARVLKVNEWLTVALNKGGSKDLTSEKLDRIFLHPWLGMFIFLVLNFLIFQAVFSWASAPADLIEKSLASLANWTKTVFAPGILLDLVSDGVIPGVGSVLVFLPQILILFLFIIILEDSGYMARAAFLMDRIMGKVGLHGRAFIPLLSSYACAIPGVMATRTIEDEKDRMATILAAPLMTCSARLPVYTLLVSAFVPEKTLIFGLNLQGVVMFGLYALGVFFALFTAFLIKKLFRSKKSVPFLMQLPSFQWPHLNNLWIGIRDRALVFLKRAGTVILSISVVLWAASTYPKKPESIPHDSNEPAIAYSVAGRVGKAIEPFFRPIGFDWRICVALIPGFAAREVMVSALGTVYAVENVEDEQGSRKLSDILRSQWSLATALSLLAWYVIALQCLSTIAVIRRETHSWTWPIGIFVYLTALAYAVSFVVYQTTVWVQGP